MMASLSVVINTANIQNLDNRLLSAGSSDHFLGTDHFGRDILLRIIVGAICSKYIPSLILLRLKYNNNLFWNNVRRSEK